MLDKLRELFGGGKSASPAHTGRGRPGTSGPRRPAKARPLSADSARLGRSRPPSSTGGPTAPRAEVAQSEIPCPNCGEPMLPGWGTTCGKCQPNLVAPKTMFMAREQVALPAHAGGGMTLGWLVVIRSSDKRQLASLIELDQSRVVLTRADAAPTGAPRVVGFDDGYMSSAHAVIGRPATGNRNDAFTIRDREAQPSANGTFVNSQKLGQGEVVRLGDGDVIKVGATELLFKSLWLPPVAARTQ